MEFLASNVQAAQLLLSRLTTEVIRYDRQLATSKCRMLLQEWRELVRVFYLRNERVKIRGSLVCMANWVSENFGL